MFCRLLAISSWFHYEIFNLIRFKAFKVRLRHGNSILFEFQRNKVCEIIKDGPINMKWLYDFKKMPKRCLEVLRFKRLKLKSNALKLANLHYVFQRFPDEIFQAGEEGGGLCTLQRFHSNVPGSIPGWRSRFSGYFPLFRQPRLQVYVFKRR